MCGAVVFQSRAEKQAMKAVESLTTIWPSGPPLTAHESHPKVEHCIMSMLTNTLFVNQASFRWLKYHLSTGFYNFRSAQVAFVLLLPSRSHYGLQEKAHLSLRCHLQAVVQLSLSPLQWLRVALKFGGPTDLLRDVFISSVFVVAALCQTLGSKRCQWPRWRAAVLCFYFFFSSVAWWQYVKIIPNLSSFFCNSGWKGFFQFMPFN